VGNDGSLQARGAVQATHHGALRLSRVRNMGGGDASHVEGADVAPGREGDGGARTVIDVNVPAES